MSVLSELRQDSASETVDLHLRVEGRRARVLDVRALEEGEVQRHLRPDPYYAGLSDISHRHRAVARLLALGLPAVLIAEKTGYTAQTIYNLQRSPAFEDLVAHYQSLADEKVLKEVADLGPRIHNAAADALEKLHQKLITDADLSPAFVLNATMSLLEKSPHVAKPAQRVESKHTHVVHLSRDEIRQIKENPVPLLQEESSSPTVEIESLQERDKCS